MHLRLPLPPITDQPEEIRIRADQHALVITVRTDGRSHVISDPGMVTPELLAILAHLYTFYRGCIEPRPPRERPSPHYRNMPKTLTKPEEL